LVNEKLGIAHPSGFVVLLLAGVVFFRARVAPSIQLGVLTERKTVRSGTPLAK
jgi:hypothetical protein